MATTVTDEGKVTIPQEIRDRLGIVAGSTVEFQIDEGGRVVLRKASPNETADPFDKWRGYAGTGPSTDEIMEMMRGEV